MEYLKSALETGDLNLLAQAQNYRALPTKRTIEAQATAATASVATFLEQKVGPLLVEARSNPVVPAALPPDLTRAALQSSERVVEIDDGDYRWIITLRTSVDPATEPWLAVAKEERQSEDSMKTRRLSLDLALAHPFSAEFMGANNENTELLLRIAAAVCISLVLSEDMTGESPASVLYHFNNLMRGALVRVSMDQ